MKYLTAIAFIFAFALTDTVTPSVAQTPSHQVDRQKAEQDLKQAMEEMRNARTPEERQRAREKLDKARDEEQRARREEVDRMKERMREEGSRGPQQVSRPPSGPYQKTCYDVRVEPVTKKLSRGGHDRYEQLYAICKRRPDQSDSSSYLRLPCHGQVVNKGGYLRCE